MALVHLNASAGTSPSLIFTLENGIGTVPVQIQNGDAAPIWIGDSSITATGATKGHVIAAAGTFQLWLHGNDKVYAVSAAGTAAGAIVITYSGQ